MKDASAEFDAVAMSGEQVITHLLRHDWDNDGYHDSIDDITRFVGSVEVTQELTSQLPQQTRIIEGGTSAELSAQLLRGNTNWYGSDITYKAVTTATSGSNTSNAVTINRPTSVDGDIIIIFIGVTNATTAIQWSQLPQDEWFFFMLRGDTSPTKRIEGFGLMRRVSADEELVYEIPFESRYTWAAVAVTIGDPGAAGLCAYMNKGQDPDLSDTFTLLEIPEYEVPRDGCLVISGFAASVTVTGASWTPTDDTEIADVTSTIGGGSQNAVVGVQIATNVAAGRYTKSSTLSTSSDAGVGFSIALAPFVSANELQHAAWTFSEINPDSPYVGKIRTYRRMIWDIGLLTENGIEYVRMFTGHSLSTDGSSRGKDHTIIALDERETERTPVSYVPPVIAENPFVSSGETLPNWPGLDLTWVVSYLFLISRQANNTVSQPEDFGFRANYGFFASPNQRRSNIFYIPCHGSFHSYFSNINSLYAFTETGGGIRRRVMFWDGPYVAATEQAPHNGGSINAKWDGVTFGSFFPGDPVLWTSADQTIGRIEFNARFFVPSAGGVITLRVQGETEIHYIQLVITQNGTMTWSLRQNGGATRSEAGPSVPTDSDWHWYGVHWNSNTGELVFAIDGVETADSFVALSNNSSSNEVFDMTLDMVNGAQIAEINVDGGTTWSGDTTLSTGLTTFDTPWMSTFVPNAFIDKSDTLLDGILIIDDTLDPWQLLQQLAAVDFAAVYFDAYGQQHWRNGRSDGSDEGQVIVRTLTARDSLMDVEYTSGSSQIANRVSVGYTPIEVVIDGAFYAPTGAIRVPAGSSVTITFEQPGPIIPSAPFSSDLTAANTLADGSGTSVSINPILVSTSFGGTLRFGTVIFENPYPYDVWIVDTSGQPSYQLTASWFQQAQDAEPITSTDSDSIRRYRTQPLSVPTSMWRQRAEAAESLSEQLIGDLSTPRPTLRNVRIMGDARLELGDRTTLQDENGIGLNGSYRLSGISSRYNPNAGFTQSITARESPDSSDWDVDSWDEDEIWG